MRECGDKTIIRDVDAQLNNLNKVSPVMAKAWEMKLPAINMYAISVAPRGEDRAKEDANRLTWESFIVLQDNQTADEQQQRAFINNLLYSRDSTKKFIYISSSMKISAKKEYQHGGGYQGKLNLLQSPRQCRNPAPEASSLVASSSDDAAGRAPWWSTWRPPGKEQDNGTVVNATIQAILEISARGEDDRWIMPQKHDVNESITIIEQCTAFSNLNIRVSFVLHRKSGVTSTSPTSPGSNSTHTFAQRQDVSILQSYLEQPH